MELSIQERLKDLRVERGRTLEQLAEEPHLSKSALGAAMRGTSLRISATMPLSSRRSFTKYPSIICCAVTGGKRHCGRCERNHYEAAQSRSDCPAVKATDRCPH